MAKIILEKGREQRILPGHPWVYRTEIARIAGTARPGDIVEVEDWRGKFVGKGFFNSSSMIAVRLLTQKDEEINADFWRQRIEQAWKYRQTVLSEANTDSFRVIFGEADFLPGLIVDKFASCLAVQTLALGIDRVKNLLAEILDEIIKPEAIYERNDAPVRELEGLELRRGFLKGKLEPPLVIISENGLQICVNIAEGQKTGYFLDQRENRAAIRPLVKGARVLDCFCHTGGFSLHAAKYQAREVIGLDISEEAIKMAEHNARLNGLENVCTFKTANVFDALRELDKSKEKFDAVILDPPAFVKSRKALEGAVRGYKEINLRALRILTPGGFLVTCSCSYHMPEELFIKTVISASQDVRRRIRIIERRGQPPDHPWLAGYDESKYLKCLIIQAL